MALTKTKDYDPKSEFEGIVVDGQEVELVGSYMWQSTALLNNPTEGVKGIDIFTPNAMSYYDTPMFIALGQGYFNLEIYDVSGTQTGDLIGLPIIIRNPDQSIISMTALTNRNKLPRMLKFMTKEKRSYLYPVLLTSAENDKYNELLFYNKSLEIFAVESNKELVGKNVIKSTMTQLPQELSAMGFYNMVTGLPIDNVNKFRLTFFWEGRCG